MKGDITPERIAARAYAHYEARGYTDGNDVEDWLSAEAELAAEQGNAEPVSASKKTVRRPAAPKSASARAPKSARR